MVGETEFRFRGAGKLPAQTGSATFRFSVMGLIVGIILIQPFFLFVFQLIGLMLLFICGGLALLLLLTDFAYNRLEYVEYTVTGKSIKPNFVFRGIVSKLMELFFAMERVRQGLYKSSSYSEVRFEDVTAVRLVKDRSGKEYLMLHFSRMGTPTGFIVVFLPDKGAKEIAKMLLSRFKPRIINPELMSWAQKI
jgi:hypothetical protein